MFFHNPPHKSSRLGSGLKIKLCFGVCGVLLCSASCGYGQTGSMGAGQAIDEALLRSSLTYLGKPFHARMEIDESKHPDGIYKASVEVFWAAPARYRVEVRSRDFDQTLVVNGTQVQETDRGDFYPAWLRMFETAVLNPAARPMDAELRKGQVRLPSGKFPDAGREVQVCAERVDRPNGISNEKTEGEICMGWPSRVLSNVQFFDYGMGYGQPQAFGAKQIATRYTAMVSSYPAAEYITRIEGRLVKLEPLGTVQPELFAVTKPTAAKDRIETRMVSTLEEEARLEHAPEMAWPAVTHGATEGYLIVHAVTDRTGQVRSAWRKSADNTWLEPYAMEQALKYKFKPMVVDGVAVQMEMPLVMHFVSRVDDGVPMFRGDRIREIAEGCETPKLPMGLMPAGTAFTGTAYVNEEGRLAGIDYAKTVPVEMQRAADLGIYQCRFRGLDGKGYRVEFGFVAP